MGQLLSMQSLMESGAVAMTTCVHTSSLEMMYHRQALLLFMLAHLAGVTASWVSVFSPRVVKVDQSRPFLAACTFSRGSALQVGVP